MRHGLRGSTRFFIQISILGISIFRGNVYVVLRRIRYTFRLVRGTRTISMSMIVAAEDDEKPKKLKTAILDNSCFGSNPFLCFRVRRIIQLFVFWKFDFLRFRMNQWDKYVQ